MVVVSSGGVPHGRVRLFLLFEKFLVRAVVMRWSGCDKLRYAEREVQSQSGHWQEGVLRSPAGLCIRKEGTGSSVLSLMGVFEATLAPPCEVLLCEHWAKQPGETWDCRNSGKHLLCSKNIQITSRIL